MLTEEVKKSIDESILCWLATATKSGVPNCSPKEVFTYRGDTELIIGDIASPGSIRNILENDSVCISFVHVLKQKGFKLRGKATYVAINDDDFQNLLPLLKPFVGTTFPVKGIIRVDISQVSPIIAPAYYMVEGTTEASQINSAKKLYGV